MCPSVSSGKPHSGHGGRPAATILAARWAKARAAPGVIRTRSTPGPSAGRSSASGSTGSARFSFPPLTPTPPPPPPGRGQILSQRLHWLVRFLLRLDDHHAAVAVPGQGDGAHPEVFEQRKVEW